MLLTNTDPDFKSAIWTNFGFLDSFVSTVLFSINTGIFNFFVTLALSVSFSLLNFFKYGSFSFFLIAYGVS